ncbi:MAG: type 4a pilus biogenesis protein PilO [Candidatus Omnitrophica bacterium]|nr:type 4a pilus biogenesis protein PilO [Candidatus Omnitrophota bacterium]
MWKNKVTIIFAALTVFIFVDLIFFLPGQISNSRNIAKKLKEVKEKIESLDRDIANKNNFLNTKKSFEEKLLDIQSRFLSKDDSTLIMSEINNLAKKSNLEITNFRPRPLQEIVKHGHITFYYLPVDLKFETSFHRLGEFLNRLEKLDFSVELTELKMKGEYPDTSITMQICGVVRE